ncbi:MAG: CRTAC1 family protein [Gemmataceae bacterium]
MQDGKLRDLLLHASGDGFTDVTAERGLVGAFPTLGVSVGDFDNDGRPDLLLTGAGGVRLFRNAGARFEDVTAKGGLDTLKGVTLSATFVDLDQDSDLDIVLAEYAATVEGALAALDGKADGSGGLVVLLNVGQARRRRREARAGAAGVPVPPRRPAARPQRPRAGRRRGGGRHRRRPRRRPDRGDRRATPAILANDRLRRFRRLATPAVAGRYNGGLILDAEHAGRSDLVLLPDGAAPQLWRSECRAGLADAKDVKLMLAGLRGKRTDADARPRPRPRRLDRPRRRVGRARPVVFHNVQGRLMPQADVSVDGEVLGLTALVGDGRAELVAWTPSGLKRLRPDGLTNRGVAVRLSGRRGIEPTGTAVRCNADGVGTFVVAQAGEMWTGAENGTLSAGLGQGRPPLLLGLGRHPRADVIRLRWPDGTWQAELNAAAGPVAVRQQNRKTTSCPVLFCHDGSRWRFVTDFLGAGTMGELQPDGSTRSPRPEEAVKIEPGVLGLTDGRYRIEVAEPMDEVTYLDRLRLDVIDHPATTQVYPDERFATGGKPATGRLIAFDRTVEPLRATDHRGTDVTDRLRRWDRATVDGFAKRAWLGFAEEHHVELDFADRLSGLKSDGPVYLCLAGWTDYAFPESIFAAGQAGVAMLPPVLERRRAGRDVGEGRRRRLPGRTAADDAARRHRPGRRPAVCAAAADEPAGVLGPGVCGRRPQRRRRSRGNAGGGGGDVAGEWHSPRVFARRPAADGICPRRVRACAGGAVSREADAVRRRDRAAHRGGRSVRAVRPRRRARRAVRRPPAARVTGRLGA